MSVTKDGDTGRWMSQIRVTDWTGKTIHKKKRGFATKGSPSMGTGLYQPIHGQPRHDLR